MVRARCGREVTRGLLVRSAADRFRAGSTIIRRDVFRGRVWSATPKRVIADSGQSLVLARWPGVELMGPGAWVASRRTGAAEDRRRALGDLATGQWDLAPWTWRDTTVLTLCEAGRYFSVELFFGTDGMLRCWYVNFELPLKRTGIGVDTFDLFLDLVVMPDGTCVWKDEDEYRHARRLGVVADVDHGHVQQARAEAVELIGLGKGPFSEEWCKWRPDPSWPPPRLPQDWLVSPTSAGRTKLVRRGRPE